MDFKIVWHNYCFPSVVGGSFETFVSGRLKVEVLLEDNKMVIN